MIARCDSYFSRVIFSHEMVHFDLRVCQMQPRFATYGILFLCFFAMWIWIFVLVFSASLSMRGCVCMCMCVSVRVSVRVSARGSARVSVFVCVSCAFRVVCLFSFVCCFSLSIPFSSISILLAFQFKHITAANCCAHYVATEWQSFRYGVTANGWF